MECCVLCLNPFLTQNAIKHRKLLYGSSFTNEVTFLNTLISSSWPGLSLRTCRLLCAQKAFICMTCQKDVIKCKKLHEQYVQLMSSILSKIQPLITPQAAAQPIQNPHVYNRKRSYQEASSTYITGSNNRVIECSITRSIIKFAATNIYCNTANI